MSKRLFSLVLFLMALLAGASQVCDAQQRSREVKSSDLSGHIIKKKEPSDGAHLGNLFNMKMTQSYSVNIATAGGEVMNVNAFTNSMRFFFTEDLTGQVDVSLLHSPFGNPGFYGRDHSNKLQVGLDAQLDYQINQHMNLHFEISRQPHRYGYYSGHGNPFGYRSAAGY